MLKFVSKFVGAPLLVLMLSLVLGGFGDVASAGTLMHYAASANIDAGSHASCAKNNSIVSYTFDGVPFFRHLVIVSVDATPECSFTLPSIAPPDWPTNPNPNYKIWYLAPAATGVCAWNIRKTVHANDAAIEHRGVISLLRTPVSSAHSVFSTYFTNTVAQAPTDASTTVACTGTACNDRLASIQVSMDTTTQTISECYFMALQETYL